MVIPDLSNPQTASSKRSFSNLPIANIPDRFLSMVLDFLIFSPVVSLVLAGLIKQTKTHFLINPGSQEVMIGGVLVLLAVFVLASFLQAVFLYYWQATPGQVFVQIRVISFPHKQEKLTFNQCLLRSICWGGGFILLGLPFLDIVGHPLRRAFHDRASDTLAVTLKESFDDGPHPLETKFISSWVRMSFLLLFLFATLSYFKTYHSLVAGEYRDSDSVSVGICREFKDSNLSGGSRLDAAITLFLMNQISADCLHEEADALLWLDPVSSQDLGYLAKFMISEGDEQEKYYLKICENEKSISCQVAQYMEGDKEKLRRKSQNDSLWVVSYLQSEDKYNRKEYEASLKIIEELQKVPSLKEALERRYVRTVWALNDRQKDSGKNSRLPASIQSDSGWFKKFKERYELR